MPRDVRLVGPGQAKLLVRAGGTARACSAIPTQKARVTVADLEVGFDVHLAVFSRA
jgi:hypothetical protein